MAALEVLITEIPFIWLLFCLIEWCASKRKLMAYTIVNIILTGVFFAVIMYFKYYGVIVNYHALAQVNQVTEVKSSVFSLMDPYYLLVFADIIVLLVLLLKSRKVKEWRISIKRKPKKASYPLSSSCAWSSACLTFCRTGPA